MRSHLTQRVFAAILENKPYIHSKCYKQLALLLPSRVARKNCSRTVQKRSLFGFSVVKPAAAQPQQERRTDNGTKQMMELMQALEQRSRPPPPFVLAKAFMAFIQGRLQTPGLLTQNQVRFLIQTYEHLTEYPFNKAGGSVRAVLEMESFEDILAVLAQAEWESDAQELVNRFAVSIFRHISHRLERLTPPYEAPSLEALRSYTTVLALSGSPTQALDVVETYWTQVLYPTGVLLWVDVIRGFAKEGREDSVGMVMEKMERCGVTLDQSSHEAMILMLAKENHVGALQTVYESKIAKDFKPSMTATEAAMKTAIWNSMLPWARRLCETLPDDPTPETRDVILLWAAANGEDADQIDQILEDMASKAPEIRSTLTISTINTLMKYAIACQKLDSVDGYVSIAHKWGLQPDTQTYMLQMDSRMQAGDVGGAIALFHEFDAECLTEEMDVLLLNKLVTNLCYANHLEVDYDTILMLIDRLTERKGRFAAETLAALCNTLLYRRDLQGISDLLRPIIDSYSTQEISRIREGFIQYISDMTESAENAWEAYELLNLAFPATPVRLRTDIMTIFFKRDRCDLACLVFGHMRQKESANRRPTAHTYAMCFHGIAGAADADSLQLVHNMLKLDLEVGLSTRVLNGLMLAYAACGMPDQAMEFFREILHSEEGPSEQTLIIFFRVCESYHNGVEESGKMMEKLKSLDIHINSEIYTAYIGALAGHCELERAVEAIRTMESRIGHPPTSFTVGTLYNAIPYQYWKGQAEEWAKVAFPELWNQLEEQGWKENEGVRKFNIDRSVRV